MSILAVFVAWLVLMGPITIAQTSASTAPPPKVPYYKNCPDTDPFVDALNQTFRESDEATRTQEAVVNFGDLASALTECADRIVNGAAGENYVRGYNDLYYAAWLHYVAADMYLNAINYRWSLGRLPEPHPLSKQGADVIIAAARAALLNIKSAKSQSFQRSKKNDDFLRGVSELQIQIESVVKQYVPERAGEMYQSP